MLKILFPSGSCGGMNYGCYLLETDESTKLLEQSRKDASTSNCTTCERASVDGTCSSSLRFFRDVLIPWHVLMIYLKRTGF